MVQFSIAYVAAGIGFLLLLGAVLALLRRPDMKLTSTQRVALLGGIGGMIVFFLMLLFRSR